MSPASIPTLTKLGLSESEQQLLGQIGKLQKQDQSGIALENAFYMGEQTIENLRIAIPDEIADRLKMVVGWARIAVDPYVERLSCEGFRLPDATDVDQRIGEILDANGFAAEQDLAYTDAMAMRRSYWMIGADPDGGAPRMTVESPLNMTVLWDVTGRRVQAAMQEYSDGEQKRAALMVPGQTIQLAQNEQRVWQVVDRDEHGFPYVPVVRMANNPRTYDRNGFSQVTPELRSLIVAACQREMNLSAASELYSVPRMLLLGAQLSDFQNPNGETRKAWESYINLINILERDEEGQLPDVKQLQTYDPAVLIKPVEHYAAQAAGILSAVPQDLGLYTDGNPVSVEAYQVAESRRDRRAAKKQTTFGIALVQAVQMALRFENGGKLPPEFERMAPDWTDLRLRNETAIADSMTKQVQEGIVPSQSDVTLKRLGYNAVERKQLEQDRPAQALEEIRQALEQAKVPAPEAPVTDGNPSAG